MSKPSAKAWLERFSQRHVRVDPQVWLLTVIKLKKLAALLADA
jgi:hypothetical protein